MEMMRFNGRKYGISQHILSFHIQVVRSMENVEMVKTMDHVRNIRSVKPMGNAKVQCTNNSFTATFSFRGKVIVLKTVN